MSRRSLTWQKLLKGGLVDSSSFRIARQLRQLQWENPWTQIMWSVRKTPSGILKATTLSTPIIVLSTEHETSYIKTEFNSCWLINVLNYVRHGQVVHKSVGNCCTRLGGGGKKQYLFQEKGQEKIKDCICLRPDYLLQLFCVAGSYCSSVIQVIWIRMNSENHNSFFPCSVAAEGCWDPCFSLWSASADMRQERLERLQLAQRKKLFSLFSSLAGPKGRKQDLNKLFYYAGYKNRKGLSKHMWRIKFQSLVSLRVPDSPLHVSVYHFLFYTG